MTKKESLYHPIDIGSLHLDGNLFLAPVAGWSDRAFRSICTDCGAVFTCTEMVSSEAIVRDNKKTALLMRRAPNERALAVQLFGSNPEVMAKAARIVAGRQDCFPCSQAGNNRNDEGIGSHSSSNRNNEAPNAIDINCGCPVPKITKGGAGSALMRDPQRLGDIVRAITEAVSPFNIPVTVKIRKGWDDSDGADVWQKCAAAAIDAGAAAITMHPRTRAQGYEGKADWRTLADLVNFAGGRVPIFGSGDLFTAEDALKMLRDTGVDAVMFARGAMGNPFIFEKTRKLLTASQSLLNADCRGEGLCLQPLNDDVSQNPINAAFRELSLLVEDAGEAAAVKIMRKRFCAYTKGMKGGAELRAALVHAQSVEDYKAIFNVKRDCRAFTS